MARRVARGKEHGSFLWRRAGRGDETNNKTVGMRFDRAPGLPFLHSMAYEKKCVFTASNRLFVNDVILLVFQ